jgi:hypothetical protein
LSVLLRYTVLISPWLVWYFHTLLLPLQLYCKPTYFRGYYVSRFSVSRQFRGKANEINYNIMTSWSIIFYNINFYQPLLKRHFEHWTPVLFILINLHSGTNKKCSRNQWGMSIERSIIYYQNRRSVFKMSLQKWLITVYIIEHDRPRCHNVVVDLVCFSNDYRIILVD